jgi:hypothetical protein
VLSIFIKLRFKLTMHTTSGKEIPALKHWKGIGIAILGEQLDERLQNFESDKRGRSS